MPSRPTIWIDTLVNSDLSVATRLLLSLNTILSENDARLSSMTLIRTILLMTLAYTVHDFGEGSQLVDFGIGIAQQEAFSAGAGSIPNPAILSDNLTRGWVFRGRYRLFGFAADQPTVAPVFIDKDIRSQRRLDNGIPYLTATQALLEGAASTTRILGLVRQLWLV